MFDGPKTSCALMDPFLCFPSWNLMSFVGPKNLVFFMYPSLLETSWLLLDPLIFHPPKTSCLFWTQKSHVIRWTPQPHHVFWWTGRVHQKTWVPKFLYQKVSRGFGSKWQNMAKKVVLRWGSNPRPCRRQKSVGNLD